MCRVRIDDRQVAERASEKSSSHCVSRFLFPFRRNRRLSLPRARRDENSARSQFAALVRKNFTLKTRGVLCCCTGVEIVLPCVFLALLCLPKLLVEDSRNNDVFAKPYQLATSWDDVECVTGYKLVVSPDSDEAREIARKTYANLVCDAARSQWPDAPPYEAAFLAKRVFCGENLETMRSRDPAALAILGAMFDFSDFQNSALDLSAACADACLRDATCYANGVGAVVEALVLAVPDADAARAHVAANPGATLAQVGFVTGVAGSSEDATGASKIVDYVLTVNTTAYSEDEEDAEFTREYFARRWGTEADSNYWKKGAHVLRVTNAVEAAIIDTKDGGLHFSANVDVSVRPYPWLGYDYNLGGIIAAGVFAIIGTLAFISNVVIISKSIVVEKELRLREGMQMMGMSSNMYWMSWFFTHWVTGMCTVVLLVVIGLYPFEYTNPAMQLIFYTLWIASCILWNYMISCAFSRSITASVVGSFVYVMSIAPAIAVRITQPNGGAAWLAVCLLPGSSINQWGDILARLELAKAGITFATAGENVNRDGTFTAWAVIGMTFLDCVLFAFMTWYLDKTWPKEYGVRLPPWFLFTKKYWFPNAAEFSDVSAAADVEETGETFEKLPPEALRNASVKIRNLKKTFDNGVVAVDDLSVTFVPGQVSALLGHNGAGKTTTISMLTGMLDATAGDARINGKSIKTDMPAIRASLGICPQFDVLWPMMTVREHLTLYAAFGGMKPAETREAVVAAVAEVALSEKLDVPTGNLSGGQKRKLSLAIAFVTKPDVVFLDEPTSGMDPYSRRFTWEVIRRRAATASIMLTTHFLDEADLLCDRIAIMSAGKLACVGSPLFLKNRYGTGYTLTLARAGSNRDGGADAIVSLVKSHVPGAKVTSDVGAELAVMLPSEGSGKFAGLFKELDGKIQSAGFASYGISCTTLEEVFLSIARGGVGGSAVARRASIDRSASDGAKRADPLGESRETKTPLMNDDRDAAAAAEEDLREGYVTGRALLARQARGLLWKRYLNWRRNAWSVLIQIIVPVLFFVLAMVLAGLEYEEDFRFAAITIDRATLLGNKPTVTSADAGDAGVAAVLARWPEPALQTRPAHAPALGCECNCPHDGQPPVFLPAECCAYDFRAANASMYASEGFPGVDVSDSGDWFAPVEAVFAWCQSDPSEIAAYPRGAACATTAGLGMDVAPACAEDADDSFDAYLWRSSEGQGTVCKDQKTVFCDAMRVESYDVGASGKYVHELYAHQTAYYSLWATSQSANAAILRQRANDDAADLKSRLEWFEKTETYEDGDIVNEPNDSTFITSLFVVMGAAVLTSSVVVFPVYERRNNSKHLQMVSGVDKRVYWLCHWLADLAQMILPMAAIMIIFAAFDIEQYRGELGGVFVLLLCFVCSSVAYTHLLGFYFANEFYAFVGLVGAKLFLGLVTTSAGMVVQAIKDLNDDTKTAHDVLSVLLPLIIPHYSFGKGLYDIGQNKLDGARMAFDAATMTARPVGRKEWWDADVIGDDIGFLVGLCVFYALVILLVETHEGGVSALAARLGALDPRALVSRSAADAAARAREAEDARDAAAEDEDVAAERARVRSVAASGFDPDRRGAEHARDARDGVILDSMSKTFGAGARAKRAVRDLSVGMSRGQCFGLLGINGAGKTSTFRMITGEFAPTRGDTKVLSSGGDAPREYISVKTELSRARRAMGYCPQFDGLQPNMTGREHLQFYAQVRGVPDDRVDAVADALIDKMALRKYCEKQAGTYSGGNKRKLSVAIALVGEPSVVLLDEPSTGMDPEARRFMWDVISASTAGRTVVLTSHSMEECEALCNRIGIMVGGRFSCLGSLQHLKNRFSEGYSVDLRFQPGRGGAVADAVADADIPGLEIVETHPTELKLRAKQEGMRLWRLFELVETLRNAPAPPLAAVVRVSGDEKDDAARAGTGVAGGSLVDDYSVSQTTLEQVFVRFASKQNEETGAAPGLAGGYRGEAMMDDARPPRRKPGCCYQVCCCGCCCPS